MFTKAKYVITQDREIIVFGEVMQHKDFSRMKPIRAGFISIGVDGDGNPTCRCYGESISLNMKSDPELDTMIAKRQLGLDSY